MCIVLKFAALYLFVCMSCLVCGVFIVYSRDGVVSVRLELIELINYK